MKKAIYALLAVLLLVPSSVFAQEEIEPEIKAKREEMLNNVKNLFPRILIDEKFEKYIAEYSTKNSTDDTGMYGQKDGICKATIYSPLPLDHESSSGVLFADLTFGTLSEFYYHLDVSLTEETPANSGSCFIQYTNKAIVGEEKRKSVELLFGLKIDAYITKASGRQFTDVLDISKYREIGKTYKIDIIRLDGISYFFIDGQYIGEYKDEIEERVSWMAGPLLNIGGEKVTCAFDNFIIRRK